MAPPPDMSQLSRKEYPAKMRCLSVAVSGGYAFCVGGLPVTRRTAQAL